MEAITHVIDQDLIINEYKLGLTEEVYTFLYKHMIKCLKLDDLKEAEFKLDLLNENAVKTTTNNYFDGEIGIIEMSKEFANRLFQFNQDNCTLVTAIATTEYGPMVAILKMDYVKSFKNNIEFINEKIGINICQEKNLPMTANKIQKAAFILKDELYVIDKGKATANEEYGRNYFIENFLQCDVVMNDRDKTKAFLNLAEQFIRRNVVENAELSENLRTSIKDKLKNEDTIEIEGLAEELFKDIELKNNFKQFMKNQNIEKLQVDKDVVDKKLNKIKLKVDKDIELNISEEAYHDANRLKIQRNGDGSINIIIKNVMNYIEK